MKYNSSIIRLVILSLLVGLIFSAPREYYIEIPIQSENQVTTITKLVSIHKIENNLVFAYATEVSLPALTQKGFSYEILPHPNENFEAQMADSREQLREWDAYPTYESYLETTYRFGENFADICQVFNIGTTVEGREMLAVKISDNVNIEENEPEFLYTAQMHGNELIGSITSLHLIDHMLANYGSDPQITHLIDDVEIWILPLINPDGAYNGGNDSIEDAIRHNANGVDLNRNFPDWMNGPHPDGSAWQPETIAMMDFAAEHSFVLASNIHSGAELANYPWDTTPVLTADDEWWQIVCHTYADTVQSYSPQGYFTAYDDGIVNGYQWYETNGNRQDYMNYFHNCKEMTLELSDVQMLPEDQLLDHWEWNRAALLNYIEECLYGVRGIVTNTQGERSGTPRLPNLAKRRH